MTPCKKHELDTREFDGSRLLIDFTKQTYHGSEKNDYAILKCPSNTVTGPTKINLEEGTDYLVIGEKRFFEPCDIDRDGVSMNLVKSSDGDNIWELHLRGVTSKFAEEVHTITLSGLDEFLDEYGNVVLQLNGQTPSRVNLYEKYFTSQKHQNIAKNQKGNQHKKIKENLPS